MKFLAQARLVYYRDKTFPLLAFLIVRLNLKNLLKKISVKLFESTKH